MTMRDVAKPTGFDRQIIPDTEVAYVPDNNIKVPRKPKGHLVVNTAYRDLCEIGYELAKGFQEYTDDWGYWMTVVGSTWLAERDWWTLPLPGHRGHKAALVVLEHLLEMADVAHINNYHSYQWITDALVGHKVVIHHHDFALRTRLGWHEQHEREAGYTRLVSTPDLLMFQDQDDPSLTWLPSPINLRELDRNYPKWERKPRDKRIHLIHAYTVAGNKGTEQFASIAKDAHPKIRLHTIHGVQRRVSWYYLGMADIYFATYLYGPGLATIEAMAMGIPALVGCAMPENPLGHSDSVEWQMQAVGVEKVEDLPWIYVTPETTEQWLKDLAGDKKLRKHWGDKGRKYVEQWHDVPMVVRRLKAIYEAAEPCQRIVSGP